VLPAGEIRPPQGTDRHERECQHAEGRTHDGDRRGSARRIDEDPAAQHPERLKPERDDASSAADPTEQMVGRRELPEGERVDVVDLVAECRDLIARGIIDKGMIPKVEAALASEAASVDSLANPAALDYFVELAGTLRAG